MFFDFDLFQLFNIVFINYLNQLIKLDIFFLKSKHVRLYTSILL